jgi:hypothetical protein
LHTLDHAVGESSRLVASDTLFLSSAASFRSMLFARPLLSVPRRAIASSTRIAAAACEKVAPQVCAVAREQYRRIGLGMLAGFVSAELVTESATTTSWDEPEAAQLVALGEHGAGQLVLLPDVTHGAENRSQRVFVPRGSRGSRIAQL